MSNCKIPPPPTPPPIRKFKDSVEICNSNCKSIVDGEYQTMCDVCKKRGLPKTNKICGQGYATAVLLIFFGVIVGSLFTNIFNTL